MAGYLWNNLLKQRIRFSYWNELCVTNDRGAFMAPCCFKKCAVG